MAVYAIGITGGSGAPYALRLIRVLVGAGHELHVVVSPSAEKVFRLETDVNLGTTRRDMENAFSRLVEADGSEGSVRVFDHQNLAAPISSGSFPCAGMVVIPCSMGSLGRIATGASTNLIERAADVTLKERRPLIVVPRETPLNDIHLENMLRLRRAGADIVAAMPAFYHRPRSIADLIDMIVARVLDRLGIENALFQRWGKQHAGEND